MACLNSIESAYSSSINLSINPVSQLIDFTELYAASNIAVIYLGNRREICPEILGLLPRRPPMWLHTGGQFVFPVRDQSIAIASISISQSEWASALTSTRVAAGDLEKNSWRIGPKSTR